MKASNNESNYDDKNDVINEDHDNEWFEIKMSKWYQQQRQWWQMNEDDNSIDDNDDDV